MDNPKCLVKYWPSRHQHRLLMSLSLLAIIAFMFAFYSESESEGGPLSGEVAIDSLLCIAYRLQGTPYLPAGKSESGFDCSGYTRYVYGKVGLDLNASAAKQYNQGIEVHPDSLQQGDLVFFRNQQGRIFHVGLYVGKERGKTGICACFHQPWGCQGLPGTALLYPLLDRKPKNYPTK